MPATKTAAEPQQVYSSESFDASTLTLDRRDSKLRKLSELRQRCSDAAGSLTIDHEINQIRSVIRAKALDENYSVALRERWQTWSRNSGPFRTALASSAASELDRLAERSDSDTDATSIESAADEPKELEDSGRSQRKRRKAFRAQEVKIKAGENELEATEAWDAIRLEREQRLSELDAALPTAFRFSERQLQAYAHRLKPKYLNSLDRPFEANTVQQLLHPLQGRPCSNGDVSNEAGSSSSTPSVFTVSYYSSSLDLRERDATDSSGQTSEVDGDNMRDDYVKRICGDGLGGMKRTQTVELLSTHTLSDLQKSLVCWSDEQPERRNWRKRLRRQLQRSARPLHSADPGTHKPPPQQPSSDEEEYEDEEEQDARFARFTGERRQTDTAIVIEDKLYSKGLRHGDEPYEAEYARLLNDWKTSLGQIDAQFGWRGGAGDLSVRLDQISPIRIGQPYWMLHQGDCVHCIVVEQIRALRPSEQAARADPATTALTIESSSKGSTTVPFPRITWLSSPAIFRFAADDKESYGLGHRILHLEGLLPFCRNTMGSNGENKAESEQQSAWQIAMSRTRRKEEGLLRKMQGKCMACTLRKAQVGILGGDRVRLPPTSEGQIHNEEGQDDAAVDGLDHDLVTVCTSCAALLGLPTRQVQPDVELDWELINGEKEPQAGWTAFPMY